VVLPAEDGRRRGPPAGPALGRVEKGLLALPQQDERLPAYAPELNPVEYLWASRKDLELANLPGATLAWPTWPMPPPGASSGSASTRTWWSGSRPTPASPSTHEPSTQLTKLNNGPWVSA
jgi:hypothetical protein